jgi:tRNA A37 methylthiotransferase MiaB
LRILLIDPPFKRFTGFVSYYFPIGLAYLATVTRNAGHDVAIFDVDAVEKGTDIDFSDEYRRLELYRQGLNDDSHIVWQDIKRVVEDFNPDIVGITAMTTKFGSVLRTAEVVKKYNPRLKVVVGGPHSTFLPGLTLKSKDIDIVVRGEGEKTFVNLIEAIENGEGLQDIKGVSFKKDEKVFHNPPQEFIEDLDQTPFPARDLLMDSHNYTSEDMGAIMTSRGCPFNCSYCCHMWQRKVRNRSIDNVIDELKEVKQRYGTKQFEFKDDTFTLNRKRTMEFCERLISEKLKINWSCTTRVDLLDEGLIKKMKKAGCNIIKLGFETGSERILKETKKGVTFAQMKTVAELLNRHGIFWSGYFMVGLPMETEEDIRQTYKLMKELNPYYVGLGVYNPFPQTELFEQGVQMGLLYPEVELEHFFDTNPKDYFFIDPSKRVANIQKEKFDNLVSFLIEGSHKHNTELRNIVRRGWARRLAYSQDWRLLLGDVKKALKWRLGKKRQFYA